MERYTDISQKIIPFFDKYPIRGVKALVYSNFKIVVEIMKVKGHLTPTGLEQIRQIKDVMNKM